MTIQKLKDLLKGTSPDMEVIFRLCDENDNEISLSFSRVELLRFEEEGINSAEIVLFSENWQEREASE